MERKLDIAILRINQRPNSKDITGRSPKLRGKRREEYFLTKLID